MCGDLKAQTSVPIHVSIVMHSEQRYGYHTNHILFEQARTNLYRFAAMLHAQGAAFNFQSDWTFLTGVTNFDQAGRAETGSTNIVAWMERDLGFGIDPHTHIGQSAYTFADVAELARRCGASPSGIVGGFAALPVEDSEWDYFQQSITGGVYTASVWQATALWGGASAGHDQDTNAWFSGIMAPTDASNLWTHAEGNLPWIGIWAGKTLNWTNLDQLIALREAGHLCTGVMYTCNLMTGMHDLTAPGFIAEFGHELATRTNLPNIRWTTLSEMTNIWFTEFGGQPFMMPFVMTNDFDNDGLIDGWEVTNFCGICEQAGADDSDGDGMENAGEFTAGTSPTNSTDYFRLLGLTASTVTWRVAAPATYVVEASVGETGTWTSIHTNSGAGPAMTYTHHAATSTFYRVAVRR